MSKKILSIIISIVVIAIVVVGCMMWYQIATTPEDNQKENVQENNTSKVDKPVDIPTSYTEEISNDPIFTLENYPKVDASLAIHPLVDSIASNFLGIDESELNFEYTKTRSSDVYHHLIDGEVDVIFAAEISKEDEAYAKEKGVELQIIPATSSAFVFIVNSENPVDSLTLEQVQDIYMRKNYQLERSWW